MTLQPQKPLPPTSTPTPRSSAPSPTASASKPQVKHLPYQAGAAALAPPEGPPGAGHQPTPSAATPVQRSPSPTRAEPRAVQRAPVKTTARTGTDTTIDATLAIPLWGPVKFQGKVSGSFTENSDLGKGGSGSNELEVSVFGGLVADFVFASLSVGVKGRIKATVPPTSNPMVALRQGIGEIMRWETARNFSAKVQAARTAIAKARAEAKASFKTITDQAVNQGHLPDLAVHAPVLAYANALQSALKAIGAKRVDDKAIFAKIAGALKPIQDLQAARPTAPEAQKKNIEARKVHIRALGATLDKLVDESSAAIDATFAQASGPANDPKVGFEAALSFEVGANIAASENLSAEVQLIVSAGIEDEQGKTAWDHSVKKSKAIAASFTSGAFQVSLRGSIKDDDEVEVTIGLCGKETLFGGGPPEATATEVAALARQTMRLSQLRELFGAKRTSAAQAAARAVTSYLGKKMKAPPKPSAAGECTTSIEIKVGGSIKQGQATKGSVKFVPLSTQVGGSAPIKKALVGGSVRSGRFVEVSFEAAP